MVNVRERLSSYKERLSAFFRERPVTTDRRVNQYLTENLPRLAREYKLATTKDAAKIDKTLEEHETSIDELEEWQADVSDRVGGLKRRIGAIEVKRDVGITGGVK